MGFTEILTLLFVILKATHTVAWSWWLVFSPELAAGVLYLLAMLGVVLGVVSVFRRL